MIAGNAMVRNGLIAAVMVLACGQGINAQRSVPPELLAARKALAAKDYQRAEEMYVGVCEGASG